jgi:hypothetical protein
MFVNFVSLFIGYNYCHSSSCTALDFCRKFWCLILAWRWWGLSIFYPDRLMYRPYFFVVHAEMLQYGILAVIPGGSWNSTVENSFVYYASTYVFVSVYTVSDNIRVWCSLLDTLDMNIHIIVGPLTLLSPYMVGLYIRYSGAWCKVILAVHWAW